MTMPVPSGYERIRAVKPFEYAREAFEPGAVLVVDVGTARRLIREKRAAAVEAEPEREMFVTNCPRCTAPMTYPKQPQESERWTACGSCGHGWLR